MDDIDPELWGAAGDSRRLRAAETAGLAQGSSCGPRGGTQNKRPLVWGGTSMPSSSTSRPHSSARSRAGRQHPAAAHQVHADQHHRADVALGKKTRGPIPHLRLASASPLRDASRSRKLINSPWYQETFPDTRLVQGPAGQGALPDHGRGMARGVVHHWPGYGRRWGCGPE